DASFFSSRRPHTKCLSDWSSDVCSSDLIGMTAVREHEIVLLDEMIGKLSAIEGVRIYGPRDLDVRSGVVSFTVDGIHPHDLSTRSEERRVGKECISRWRTWP